MGRLFTECSNSTIDLMHGMKSLIRLLLLLTVWPWAASRGNETNQFTGRLQSVEENLAHLDARLSRQMNQLLWMQRLQDLALIDIVRFTGPPPHSTNTVPPPAGSNDVIVSAFTFVPRERNPLRKLPLIVLAHGEIHGNLVSDEELHVVRELLLQGYALIAPDYRGSSGYGADFWKQIDYGGLEVEDVHAGRQWMLQHHHEIDPNRVGISGWSHGGLIALLSAFAHPEDYQACYAGVPVSDLEERIRIRGKGYEELFSAPYHLGKTLLEAPEEYRRRSPAWNAEKLRIPLLIHTNTNDDDVTARDVEPPSDQGQERRLSRTGATDDPGRRPWPERERKVVQNRPLTVRIRECDVLHFDEAGVPLRLDRHGRLGY